MNDLRHIFNPSYIAAIAVGATLCTQIPRAFGAENGGNGNDAAPRAEPADFSIGAELRDPFWPVGYLPPEQIPEQEQQVEQVAVRDEQRKKALAKLRYGGTIKSGGRVFATVNGAMVQKGDIVAVTVDGELFKFKVHGISMKGVKFKIEK